MHAFVFNTRRAIFADRTVRHALAHVFDFDWINKTLLHDAYVRTRSIFDNSELGSRGVPEGGELALLEPFRDRLPAELFDRPYVPPGMGGAVRANLRKARRLSPRRGGRFGTGSCSGNRTGCRWRSRSCLVRSGNEKIALGLARNLERLGVEARVRTVDTAQYQNRRNVYDFDMLIYRWGMSLSPGNEQAFYWGSQAAGEEGTRNYPGVRDPVVDSLIKHMTNVRAREDFVDTIRAMDRVLLRGHYFVPLYHRNVDHVAWWGQVRPPGGDAPLRSRRRSLVGGSGEGGRPPAVAGSSGPGFAR